MGVKKKCKMEDNSLIRHLADGLDFVSWKLTEYFFHKSLFFLNIFLQISRRLCIDNFSMNFASEKIRPIYDDKILDENLLACINVDMLYFYLQGQILSSRYLQGSNQ